MPSSGARSGTRPSRSGRGAGDGTIGAVALKCGHSAHDAPVTGGPRSLYRCPEGCGLVAKK